MALKYLIVFLNITIFYSYGCSIKKIAINQAVSFMEEGRKTFETEGDLELAEVALGGNLKLLESFSIHSPHNKKLNLFLAEGYSVYTLAFVEDKFEEYLDTDPVLAGIHRKRAIYLYTRARDYAAREFLPVLEINSPNDISAVLLTEKLKYCKKSDVPALFWFAFSWGAAINLDRDNLNALSALGYVAQIMERVRELHPDYYYGGASLFEGIYYGARPPMLGGDPERSMLGFNRAFAATDKKMLMTYYYLASTYCVQNQDHKCFKDNLNYVIEMPADIFPEQILANEVAKKKALRLLAKESDLFLE